MEIDALINLILNAGFPVGMCIYLIVMGQRKDDKTNDILNNFSLNIQENTNLLKQMHDLLQRMNERGR